MLLDSCLIYYFLIAGLVNGSNALEGRIEVYVNGQWGVVCEDFWNLADGVVACKQLGYGSVYDTLRRLPFGANEDIPILVDNLACSGRENRIQDCPGIFGNMSHNCDHSEDAGLVCIDASKFEYSIATTLLATVQHS